MDYSLLLVYPLLVLATNRALDTIISRKPRNTWFIPNDLIDTYKVGKLKALYAGLLPTVFFAVLFSTSLTKQVYSGAKETSPLLNENDRK